MATSHSLPSGSRGAEAMDAPSLDSLPGFRRRFIVTPSQDRVCGAVKDDFHCMSVTIHHSEGIATAIEPVVERAPWTTCPGAAAQLVRTFTGVALGTFAVRGEKTANCTHLHDLALLAAAHAYDAAPLTYDILVCDPEDGRRRAELRRDGKTVLSWVHTDGVIVEPEKLAGVTFDKLRPWIESLDSAGQEAARLLRWGTMVANGRTIPMEFQSDASRLARGSCYTFQPDIAKAARRVGEIRDFSRTAAQPLERRASFVQSECLGAQHSQVTAHSGWRKS